MSREKPGDTGGRSNAQGRKQLRAGIQALTNNREERRGAAAGRVGWGDSLAGAPLQEEAVFLLTVTVEGTGGRLEHGLKEEIWSDNQADENLCS